jgi:hypothetical protein
VRGSRNPETRYRTRITVGLFSCGGGTSRIWIGFDGQLSNLRTHFGPHLSLCFEPSAVDDNGGMPRLNPPYFRSSPSGCAIARIDFGRLDEPLGDLWNTRKPLSIMGLMRGWCVTIIIADKHNMWDVGCQYAPCGEGCAGFVSKLTLCEASPNRADRRENYANRM